MPRAVPAPNRQELPLACRFQWHSFPAVHPSAGHSAKGCHPRAPFLRSGARQARCSPLSFSEAKTPAAGAAGCIRPPARCTHHSAVQNVPQKPPAVLVSAKESSVTPPYFFCFYFTTGFPSRQDLFFFSAIKSSSPPFWKAAAFYLFYAFLTVPKSVRRYIPPAGC